METALRYLRVNEQFFVFSRRAPYMVLRDAGPGVWDESRREKERIIAELCVDLIDKYRYHLSQLHVQELIPIVSQEGWRYPEADVLAEGGDGNPRLIVKAVSPAEYRTASETGIEELFLLARAIPSRKTTPLFAVFYTRWREKGRLKEQHVIINTSLFPTSDAWTAAGRPVEQGIPAQANA